MEIFEFSCFVFNAVVSQIDVDGIASSVDPDQTAPKEQSDLGLHSFLRPICPNILNCCRNCFFCRF